MIGNPLDLERWAHDPGMETWGYANCLPYFKRMETCLAGVDEYRAELLGSSTRVTVRLEGDASRPMTVSVRAVARVDHSLEIGSILNVR